MPVSAGAIRYSIVVPIFNEAPVLPLLLRRLDAIIQSLDGPVEVILVNDGSTDESAEIIRAKVAGDERYREISLSRNFGHQIAITAGMEAAAGDAVIVMDADLQDPPEVIGEMIARWKQGYDIVYARRSSRAGESPLKRWTASLFYRVLSKLSSVEIPRDVGDFRLVDRKALDVFRAMPERDRMVRGMFAWLGFRQTAVDFDRPPRAAGETKYPLWKMLRLAVHGIIGFSDAPLRLAIWFGLVVSALAVLYGIYVVGLWFADAELVTGWSSIVVIVSLLCGANMILTGIVGLYVGRIHAEVKRRPLYVVDRMTGFDRGRAAAAQQGAAAGPLKGVRRRGAE
ncbi:MAG TPA: glycosyltransferase family 2 protein [Microvirga sp.]|nr:glycosyltransferase family 2 protein [Microvirga sp.]